MITTIPPSLLASIIQADYNALPNDTPIQTVSIDSRKIYEAGSTVFFALKGVTSDGHQFILSCYGYGVRNFVVQRNNQHKLDFSALIQSNIFVVADVVDALQKLAAWQMEQYEGLTVGITGSNGKTIIKEWLGQVLSSKFQVAKSPKSYNSQIGVPLSVFSIEKYHQVAVLEAGISHPGEMRNLGRIIQPDIGIITNIGPAHGQNFDNDLQKLKEKLLLFKDSKFLIYRKDQLQLAKVVENTFPANRLIAWSDQVDCDYILRAKKGKSDTRFLLIKPDMTTYTFRTEFLDEASLENLRHVIVAALTIGMSCDQIQLNIAQLDALAMRLSVKAGKRNCTLVDDTYNNDLAGLEIALAFLATQRKKNKRILILSDLPQVSNLPETYQRVEQLIQHYHIDLFIGVGHEIRNQLAGIQTNAVFYPSTGEFLESDRIRHFSNDLILVKGARAFHFEQIVHAMEEQIHGTVLEIDFNALSHNVAYYRKKIEPRTKIMAMVKAAAYGGGAAEIANHLQTLRIDYLSVAYPDEGAELREKGIHLPIMVLNTQVENLEQMQRYNLEPVIYSMRILHAFGTYCQKESVPLTIHLDIDTGMRRLGFDEDSLITLCDTLPLYPELKVASIFTHLTSTDDPAHDVYTRQQLDYFLAQANEISDRIGYRPMFHALNTAGIVRFDEYSMDMVRLGIGLYGIAIENESKGQLHQVGSLKTTISQIKHVKKGEPIGYGRKGVMPENGKIATIGLGYADGFDRRFSNGVGYVLIHGQKAPVIGNVCMDMTMVNITGIEAAEGDPVTVYGEGIDLSDLAAQIGTIPYELLTHISGRVKRVYYLD